MSVPCVGWVGLGDQGAPIARAIAEVGYPLHAWARRPSSLGALDGAPYTTHDTAAGISAAADIVGLCLNEDKDNRQLMVDGGLLAAMRPGSVLVNYGTGLPAFAAEITLLAAAYGIDALDAPVSGGRGRWVPWSGAGPSLLPVPDRCQFVLAAVAGAQFVGGVGREPLKPGKPPDRRSGWLNRRGWRCTRRSDRLVPGSPGRGLLTEPLLLLRGQVLLCTEQFYGLGFEQPYRGKGALGMPVRHGSSSPGRRPQRGRVGQIALVSG